VGRPDKRREIMNVAERLFTTRRFHEITTDQIAAEAGVGKGTIYRFFRDKEDLFFQTAMSGFDELCDLVRQGSANGGSFREQLLEACAKIHGFLDRRWPLLRLMHSEEMRALMCKGEVHRRMMAHKRDLESAVGEIVERGVAEGEIRNDVPPKVLAAFLLGMLRTHARELPDVPMPSQGLDLVVDLFCRGAGLDSPSPARRGRTSAARRAT
jgi:AcrR family transcriptional regulator